MARRHASLLYNKKHLRFKSLGEASDSHETFERPLGLQNVKAIRKKPFLQNFSYLCIFKFKKQEL